MSLEGPHNSSTGQLSEAQGCKAAFTTAGSSLPWDDAVDFPPTRDKMMELGFLKKSTILHALQEVVLEIHGVDDLVMGFLFSTASPNQWIL